MCCVSEPKQGLFNKLVWCEMGTPGLSLRWTDPSSLCSAQPVLTVIKVGCRRGGRSHCGRRAALGNSEALGRRLEMVKFIDSQPCAEFIPAVNALPLPAACTDGRHIGGCSLGQAAFCFVSPPAFASESRGLRCTVSRAKYSCEKAVANTGRDLSWGPAAPFASETY